MSQNSRRRLPAEWEPLAAVWLAWPHNRNTWPGNFQPIPAFFADFACQVARSVPVRLVVPERLVAEAKSTLAASRDFDARSDIRLHPIPTNDCWIRDYGPLWVHDSESDDQIAVDFVYNAWGGKYPPWDDDARAARAIARLTGHRCESSKLCLEGGALETDGRGRLLTTKSCLITPTRNRGWTQEVIAGELHRRLGVTEIVWLEGVDKDSPLMRGDDTDGHVDQLARFVDPTNVVVAAARDASDENHASLDSVYRQLRLWGASTSPRVDVHRLFAPPPRYVDGQRVPESYCNFLRLGGDRLLLPSFGSPASDAPARATMQELLPACRIETIDCRDLVWGLGALHCASRDQPAALGS